MTAPIRSVDALIASGLAGQDERAALEAVQARYATLIPPAFLALIGSADDAIGRQVVPHPDESAVAPHELADPTGDAAHSPVPGIVRRYADRALLKPLLVCPLYCRFCFRREHVGPGGGVLDDASLGRALDWLAATPEIEEVILTGGDPLMLSPRRLGGIVRALDAMPHISTIRIHTRVPVAAPERVTEALADCLETSRAMWVVLHANHAREFTPEALAAVRRLQRRAIPVLGQSVLLRGVNDDVASLEALLRAMVRARIKPYYLHQLDPAPGTARFAVPIEEGQALLAALRGRVTGLAWPAYVLDIEGGHGKVPIGPDYLVPGTTQVRDPSGRAHPLGAHNLARRTALALEARSALSDPTPHARLDHEAAGQPDPRRTGDRA